MPGGTARDRARRERHREEQKNRCHWCGCELTDTSRWAPSQPTDCTLDHLYERDTPERLELVGEHVAACLKCNRERGAQRSAFIPF